MNPELMIVAAAARQMDRVRATSLPFDLKMSRYVDYFYSAAREIDRARRVSPTRVSRPATIDLSQRKRIMK